MLYSEFNGKNYGTETLFVYHSHENYGKIKSILKKIIQKTH